MLAVIKEINVNKDVKLGVIGCGNMASAILGGVYNNSFLKQSDIFLYDVNNDAVDNLVSKYNFNKTKSISDLLSKTNTILLAIKPFVIKEVLDEIKKDYNNHLILTIVAGVKIKKYNSIINSAKIIRIMPNTPSLINEGMSAVCSNDKVDIQELDFGFNFMKNCGKVIKTTEDKIDIITALSGSGPAFYYRIIDLMAKSAQKLGLSYDEAVLLSSQTALGSAKMILENDFQIEQLIKNVTTPGGCTEVGNNVLNESEIDKILDKTIKDTMQKAIELG